MFRVSSGWYIRIYTAIHNVDEVSPYNFFCLYYYSNRHLIRMRTALNVGKRSQRESDLSEIVAAVQVIINCM